MIDLTCSIWFGLIDLIVLFDDWFEGGFVDSIVNLIDWFIQGYFTRSPLVHSLVNYWYITDHYIIPTDHFTRPLVNHWYITRQPFVHSLIGTFTRSPFVYSLANHWDITRQPIWCWFTRYHSSVIGHWYIQSFTIVTFIYTPTQVNHWEFGC